MPRASAAVRAYYVAPGTAPEHAAARLAGGAPAARLEGCGSNGRAESAALLSPDKVAPIGMIARPAARTSLCRLRFLSRRFLVADQHEIVKFAVTGDSKSATCLPALAWRAWRGSRLPWAAPLAADARQRTVVLPGMHHHHRWPWCQRRQEHHHCPLWRPLPPGGDSGTARAVGRAPHRRRTFARHIHCCQQAVDQSA